MFSKISIKTAFLAAFAVLALLALAPRKIDITQAESCSNPPTHPAFNVYQIDFSGSGCTDYPTMMARVLRNGQEIQGYQSVYNSGANAQAGDELDVVVYVHNGAAENLDPEQTTARGIYLNTTVDGTFEPEHTISVTVTSQNAATVNGAFGIHTASNEALQVIPNSGAVYERGNPNAIQSGLNIGDNSFSLGDMHACYQYLRFVHFRVKVVAKQVQPTANISAQVGSQVNGQCLLNGSVTWSSENVTNPRVYVKDVNDNFEQLLASAPNGTSDTPWLKPNDSYIFTFRGDNIQDKTANVTTGNLSCAVPPAGKNTITAQAGNQIGAQCLRDGTVSWTNASNVSIVEVTVQDITTSSPVNSITGPAGFPNSSSDTPWLTPGDTFRYILYDTTNGQHTELARYDLNVPTLNCVVTPPVSYTLTTNKTDYCVGDIPQYTITSSPALAGKKILWSSFFNGQPTGEINTDYGFYLDANGFWSAYGSGWYSKDIGSWVKEANIDGVKKSVSFTVRNCAAPVPTLTCTPENQTTDIGTIVFFTANGGTSPYTFTAPEGVNSFPNGSSGFHTTYFSAGDKVVTVKSTDGQTAICNVHVKTPPSQTLVCSPSSQTVNVNQSALFSATGGKGSYTWIANGGSPASGAGGSFSTQYASSGSKTVTVASSDGQTANCYVQVSPPIEQNLVCTTLTPSVDINQTANFSATGGNGSYSWSAVEGYPSSGVGNSFSSKFATSGSKTAVVTSGSKTATCYVQVSQPVVQKGVLQISKEVRNVTSGGDFSHTAFANQNDIVEYRIKVSAATNVVLQNVKVTDTSNSGIAYVDGTLTQDGAVHAPGLTSGGIIISQVGQTPVVFTYRAKVLINSGSVINTASASADNAINTPYDQAVVTVTFIQPGQPSMTITKQVMNVTKNTGFSSSVSATKGDTVKYQIVVSNVGNADATNVFVNDSNPIGNITGLTVSRSGFGGTFGASGISLGTLAKGESVTITYSGTVNIDNGNILNVATVSASNAASQNASANVYVSTSVIPPIIPPSNYYYYNNTSNNCVNNSCNTTTTTTNTYNNTYYYYSNQTTPVPSAEFRQLGIRKLVRNINGGTFQESITANNGDIVEYEVVVTNIGNQVVNNVKLTDSSNNGGLSWTNSTYVDGSQATWNGNALYLGSLFTGQQKRVVYQARVNGASGASIQNIAVASGDNTNSVQDSAWVFISGVAGSNVNLTYSKRAFNDTKNVDATTIPANREEYITYTLTVFNNGNAPANNFVISDDLSQVLPYADLADNGGGTISGNVISFPGITVPQGGSVQRSFKVRIKYHLAENLNYVMTNTYGNTVTININTPQVKGAFIAPRTGADTMALAFGGLLTSAFALIKKRKYLMTLIFT